MGRRKTHEEFIRDFYEKNIHAKNIEILSKYKKSNIKIKCRCRVDDYEWEVKPNDLLKGYGCPKCSGLIKLTHEEFVNKMKQVNFNIEVLGEYINSRTKIKVRCRVDGYEWSASPNNLLRGYGCPKCSKKIKNKTTEYFKQELKKINSDIEILGEYKGNDVKIKCRCLNDNYIWYTTPSILLSGSGCPKCNISKGEKRIMKFLNNKNIMYIYDEGYFKDLKGIGERLLRPDFIIEDRKIWIEFDGEQHFRIKTFGRSKESAKEQFKITQENDKIKNEYAKANGWKLIRIPYWEYDRIEEILEKEF